VWQQFRSGAEVPSLSFTARWRGIQRELPSTLTNGQKVDRTFQRKTFHARPTFFVGPAGVAWHRPCSTRHFGPDGKCRVLKALHDSVAPKVHRTFGQYCVDSVNELGRHVEHSARNRILGSVFWFQVHTREQSTAVVTRSRKMTVTEV
jgi:hypothetical protein